MRIFIVLLTLFACTGHTMAAPAIEHWQVGQTRVYFIAAPNLPMIDIQIAFDAGGARDGVRPGLAAMANGMLAEGAEGMNADAIAQAFDDVGARFSNGSEQDMAWLKLRALVKPELLNPALATFNRVLAKPNFPADAFERLRKQQQVTLAYEKQAPESVASKAFYRMLYGEHPYAAPDGGTEESIQAMTLAELQAFYRQYYVAANAVIAIVGALDRPAAEQMAQSVIAGLPVGEAAPALAQPQALPSQTQHIDHPSTQTHIWLGQLGYSRQDPDYFTLYVGNHILGGNGLISRIATEIREKRGLSYSAYSQFMPMRVPGPFLAILQTANEQALAATQVLRDTLRQFIAQGPSEQELEEVKKNLTGGFPLKIDNNGKLLGYLAMIGFYGLPTDYLETWTTKVNAVTREQIQQTFQKRLNVDNMMLLTVGRKPAMEAPPAMAGTQSSLWNSHNSHPRVLLPIQTNDKASCPYCGVEYALK